MNLNNINTVYFVGIGGIGMSALARYFNTMGITVFGYDLTSTLLTKKMESNGITIVYEENTNTIPSEITENKESSLIVYTPAIPKGNAILNYFIDKCFSLKKRAEVLGIISKKFKTIAVAGTHGKTTTSSMIASVMDYSSVKCNAFLGGIATNFNSNLVLNKSAEWVVVEADEYDRSFLTLVPNIAIITSTDADHLDIYGNENTLKESFQEFVDKINPTGKLFSQSKVDLNFGNTENYDLDSKSAKYYSENRKVKNGNFVFDTVTPTSTIKNIELGINGLHNIENAIATIAVCQELGINDSIIKEGLENYKGVKRRFEYHIKNSNLIYIDDYAHHPTEIKALVSSIKELYPEKKITGIFQPHLFSRTKDFADEFATELAKMDEIILLEIYPARELPMEGITSEMLQRKIGEKALCTVRNKSEVIEDIKNKKLEILLTIGAGDISELATPIKEALTQN